MACLNAFMSLTARMSEGRAFHAESPAYEKERSPNLDRSWGRAGCWSESGTRTGCSYSTCTYDVSYIIYRAFDI